MLNQFSRTRLLLGDEGMERLFAARVAVFGSGLTAAFAAEALVRSGIGAIDVFGADAALVRRLLSINPDVRLTASDADARELSVFSYIIDAAQAPTKTVDIAATAAGVPIISVMDMSRRMDVASITVGDINKIKRPYADKLSFELRRRGVKKLKCVWSDEEPESGTDAAHVLTAAGLIAAGETVKDLMGG